jgi:hypothetical protein
MAFEMGFTFNRFWPYRLFPVHEHLPIRSEYCFNIIVLQANSIRNIIMFNSESITLSRLTGRLLTENIRCFILHHLQCIQACYFDLSSSF